MPKKEVIQVISLRPIPICRPLPGSAIWSSSRADWETPGFGEVGRGVREHDYALQRVKTILEAAGTSLDNVLTVTTHLTTRKTWRLTTRSTPSSSRSTSSARTTVEVMPNSPELPGGDHRNRLHPLIDPGLTSLRLLRSQPL